jgi:hypothetical protein
MWELQSSYFFVTQREEQKPECSNPSRHTASACITSAHKRVAAQGSQVAWRGRNEFWAADQYFY